jgi:hypothetical protein
MASVVLYVNGGRFELADTYSAESLAHRLSNPGATMMSLRLATGGQVRFGISPSLAWAVEELEPTASPS